MTFKLDPKGHQTSAAFCRYEKREQEAVTGCRLFTVVDNSGRALFQGTADEVAAWWSSALGEEGPVAAPPETDVVSAPLEMSRKEAAS